MIINCPECNKKFEIDQNLIPANGRLLQCGSCNHEWFFKLNKDEETKVEVKDSNIKKKVNKITEPLDSDLEKKIDIINKDNNLSEKKAKSNNNNLNILLVIIISIVAFVLVLDTFQDHLISVFPNIKFLLNNLYQSLEDIKLFVLDLIK
tara:strand:+ start:118 stop:564 length:447 start_codon:yes stop_codon:yes gene_type:complete